MHVSNIIINVVDNIALKASTTLAYQQVINWEQNFSIATQINFQ